MSGLRIVTNVPALVAGRQLFETSNRVQRSLERLSSGLRVNRAADDAAGLALSERIRTQVNGLERAQKNVQDGISVLQVADGGVSQIADMIQRIRTLAVQAASDTLTSADRALIQVEVDELLAEIDRQASVTKFGNLQLLTGNFGGANGPTQVLDANGVVVADARPNFFFASLADPPTTTAEPPAGFEFAQGDYDDAEVIGGGALGLGGGAAGENLTFRFQFNPSVSDPSRVTQLRFRFVGGSDIDADPVAGDGPPGNIRYQLFDFSAGAWVDVGNNNVNVSGGPFGEGTSNAVTSNPSRFFDADGDVWAQAWIEENIPAPNEHQLTIDYAALEVTSRTDPLVIQAGANQGETISIELPDARAAALGLTGLSVATRAGAEAALTTTSDALDELQSAAARIGASLNRLERASTFIGISRENQAAADSRIRELDFADEIVKFTKDQILQQTGVSALAQANLIPSAVLALLG